MTNSMETSIQSIRGRLFEWSPPPRSALPVSPIPSFHLQFVDEPRKCRSHKRGMALIVSAGPALHKSLRSQFRHAHVIMRLLLMPYHIMSYYFGGDGIQMLRTYANPAERTKKIQYSSREIVAAQLRKNECARI